MSLLYELMHRNVNVFSLSIFIVENAHYNTIDIFYKKASHTEDFFSASIIVAHLCIRLEMLLRN